MTYKSNDRSQLDNIRYAKILAKRCLAGMFLMTIFSLVLSCGGGGGEMSVPSNSSNSSNIAVGTNPTTLEWDPPREASVSLSGYKVYYGTASHSYSNAVDVGNTPSAVIDSLPKGVWYFAVCSYDGAGNESSYSNEVAKEIR